MRTVQLMRPWRTPSRRRLAKIILLLRRSLDQFAAARQTQFLDDLADVLRMIAVGDEKRIFGVDDDKVFNANYGNKLFGAVDVVVPCLDGEMAFGFGDISVAIAAQAGFELVL